MCSRYGTNIWFNNPNTKWILKFSRKKQSTICPQDILLLWMMVVDHKTSMYYICIYIDVDTTRRGRYELQCYMPGGMGRFHLLEYYVIEHYNNMTYTGIFFFFLIFIVCYKWNVYNRCTKKKKKNTQLRSIKNLLGTWVEKSINSRFVQKSLCNHLLFFIETYVFVRMLAQLKYNNNNKLGPTTTTMSSFLAALILTADGFPVMRFIYINYDITIRITLPIENNAKLFSRDIIACSAISAQRFGFRLVLFVSRRVELLSFLFQSFLIRTSTTIFSVRRKVFFFY